MKSSLLPLLLLVALLAGGAGLAGGYLLGQQRATHGAPATLPEQPSFAATKPDPAPLPAERGGMSPLAPEPQAPTATAEAGPAQPKPVAEAPVAQPRVADPETARSTDGEAQPDREDMLRHGRETERARERLEKLSKQLEDGFLPDNLDDPFGGPKVAFSGRISGTVTDANGNPVAGAQLSATFGEHMESGGNNRMMRISVSSSADGENSGQPLATSGADGTFTIALDREVTEHATLVVNLTAKATGYAASKRVTVHLQNGEHEQGVAVALRGAGGVSGRVVDATGRGVAGVTVSLSGRGEMPDLGGEGEIMLEMPGSDGRYRAVTDGTGQFVINDVPEGRYRARLRGTGWRQVSGPTELDIKAGHQTTAPADFVVSATAALVARFADGAGAAISGGATVVFRDSSGRSIRRMHGTLGADGTLTLNDPPVGTFDVEITVWGYKPTTIQAAIQEGLPTDVGLQTLTPDDGKGGAIFLPGDEDD